MRNEIFSQINRNKIRYYSELKKPIIEKISSSGPVQSKIEKEVSRKRQFQHTAFKKFNSTDNNRLLGAILSVHMHMIDLSEKTKSWIKSINNSLMQEVNNQSNKFTNGLSRISSQLFEDRYEYQQHNNFANYMDRGVYNGSEVIALNLDILGNSQQTQFKLWLNRLYFSIILFLESDEWFDKIEQSQHMTSQNQQHNHLKTNLLNKLKRVSENFNPNRLLCKYGAKSKMRGKLKMAFDKKNLNNQKGKFINTALFNYLKSISNTIFPAINRFIQ